MFFLAITIREVNCNAFITYIVNYHSLASVIKQKEYQPLKSVIMPTSQTDVKYNFFKTGFLRGMNFDLYWNQRYPSTL